MKLYSSEEAERLAQELSDKVNALVVEYERNTEHRVSFHIKNTESYRIKFSPCREHFMALEADKLKANDQV